MAMAMSLTFQMHSLSQLPFYVSPSTTSAPFGAKYEPKFSVKLRTETRLVHNAMLAQNDAVVAVGEDLPDDYANRVLHRANSDRRRAGILLHPTSFPGPYGIGDLGSQAFRFLDWLHDSGCSLWQVLPLVPPGRRANEEGSPYSGQLVMQGKFAFWCY